MTFRLFWDTSTRFNGFFFLSFFSRSGLALNPSPPRPLTQASHPPAGRRASCLVEGGDGAADGWEDDRNDKKESLWED